MDIVDIFKPFQSQFLKSEGWGMAQVVECLPSKLKAPSSILSTAKKVR
jgi:hypothetical protein